MKQTQNWLGASIRAVRDVTPTVREFEIGPDAGEALPHEPGAHLQLQVLVGHGAAARLEISYSLVGEADGRAHRIAVKRLDDGRGGSLAMWRLVVGDRLQISEPQNHFSLDLTAPAYLLVAGGIGITPLVLMAQRLQQHTAKTGAALRMLYGARSQAELAYLPVLNAALGDRLQVHAADVAGGSVMDLAAEIATLPEDGQLYTCGPAPLLEALKLAWAEAGRPPENLRFETFGNTGRLATTAFTVRLPRHGLELEVPANATLLDVLEGAGVQAMSGCRRGECGLCALDVLELDGEIDHRDVFFSDHEKQQGRRICICVSRVAGSITLESAYRAA